MSTGLPWKSMRTPNALDLSLYTSMASTPAYGVHLPSQFSFTIAAMNGMIVES